MLAAAGLFLGLFGPPPDMSVTNGVDPLFNVTLGAPGSCSCQVPSDCDGHALPSGATAHYSAASGCEHATIAERASTGERRDTN